MLVLRTMAIWHGDKRIGILLGIFLTSTGIGIIYYATRYLRDFTHLAYEPVLADLLPNLPSCGAKASNTNYVTISYVLFMVFESGNHPFQSSLNIF